MTTYNQLPTTETSNRKQTHGKPVTRNEILVNKKRLLIIFFFSLFCSCTTVKEYQKNRINDAEMELAARKIQKTELSFQTYREGASGANGGKTGGGCGCN